jgi:hypothetical protein
MLLVLSLSFVVLRYLWGLRLPTHGDLGYFVDPRCIQDRRYHFKDSMVTYLLGCFRVFACWFYQTAWIIAGNYKRFKKVKNLMTSALMIISGIAVYRIAGLIEVNATIAYIVYLLIISELVWAGYVTTADVIVMCLMPVILFYWLHGLWWIAFALIAVDVFANKPIGIFIYGPLTLYSLYLQPHKFIEICGPLLLGLLLWNVWLWFNGNSMKLALNTIAPLNWPATYAKEKTSGLLIRREVYHHKLRVLWGQFIWSPAFPLVALGSVLLYGFPHPIVLVMLLGILGNWIWQNGRNWYYIMPIMPMLALLAANGPPLVIIIAVLAWVVQQLRQWTDTELCLDHLLVLYHFRKCIIMEHDLPLLIKPGHDLTLIGNLTNVWHITHTVCPDPKILGWGSNAFLSLQGRHPEWYDNKTWHIPAPWTDYVVAVLVRNPSNFLGGWYVPIAQAETEEVTIFAHLKMSDNWEEIRQALLTYFEEGGTIPDAVMWDFRWDEDHPRRVQS